MSALDDVRDLAEAVARRRSLRIWDVEMGSAPRQPVVRVFVDGDDGIDLDTVAQVAEEISRGLDLKDPIERRYTLEVSSPGLERKLRSPEHWALSIGRRAVVKTIRPITAGGHRIEGVIARSGDAAVTLATDAGEVEVPFDSIKSARTVFEWK